MTGPPTTRHRIERAMFVVVTIAAVITAREAAFARSRANHPLDIPDRDAPENSA